MHRLELKATHKPVRNYSAALRQFDNHTKEGPQEIRPLHHLLTMNS